MYSTREYGLKISVFGDQKQKDSNNRDWLPCNTQSYIASVMLIDTRTVVLMPKGLSIYSGRIPQSTLSWVRTRLDQRREDGKRQQQPQRKQKSWRAARVISKGKELIQEQTTTTVHSLKYTKCATWHHAQETGMNRDRLIAMAISKDIKTSTFQISIFINSAYGYPSIGHLNSLESGSALSSSACIPSKHDW